MNGVVSWLVGSLVMLVCSLLDGLIAYLWLNGTFHLGFTVWWGIAFVGMEIVMTGTQGLRNRK